MRSAFRAFLLWHFFASILVSGAAVAQQEGARAGPADGASPDLAKEAARDSAKVVYMPPSRGAPGGRVGGGTRGTARDQFILLPLAPDHSGLTTQDQPTLYWYMSRPTSLPIEFTLTEAQATTPVVEVRLPAMDKAGFQHFSLADQQVRLNSGVAYRWFVAVVADPKRRSKDILAGGAIERVDASTTLNSIVSGLDKPEAAIRLAQRGIWYDALQLLCEAIDADPTNADARQMRELLLSQVGLGGLTQQ